MNFNEWFNENKNSEELLEAYRKYLFDFLDTSTEPGNSLTFKSFAKTIYDSSQCI